MGSISCDSSTKKIVPYFNKRKKEDKLPSIQRWKHIFRRPTDFRRINPCGGGDIIIIVLVVEVSRRSVTVGQVKSYYSCYVSFGVVGSLLLLSTQKIVRCVWKYGFGTIFLFQQQQQQTIIGEFI
jgi:hypothetical protein